MTKWEIFVANESIGRIRLVRAINLTQVLSNLVDLIPQKRIR